MASSSWLTPGSANGAFGGVGTSWSDAANIQAAGDDSFALCALSGGGDSDDLAGTTFDFASDTSPIPGSQVVDGIEVRIDRDVDPQMGSPTITDVTVRLIEGGAYAGDNKASATPWSETRETVVYGGPTDTWGLGTIDIDDASHAAFGVGIKANLDAGQADAKIYSIEMRIFISVGSRKRKLIFRGVLDAAGSGQGTGGLDMQRQVKKGDTDQSFNLVALDSDGAAITGLDHDDIDLWYRREGAAVVTLGGASLADLTSSHTDGGVEEIRDGYYRADFPDAAFASGASGVQLGGIYASGDVLGPYVHLVDYDPQDGTKLGLSLLPGTAGQSRQNVRIVHANESTAGRRRVYFQLVDAVDGVTPETGEGGGQPQISSDGGGWTNTGIGVLTHIGNGRYYADLTQTAVATAGTWIETRYKSANTTEAAGDSVHVVGYNPASTTNLGLSALPAFAAGGEDGLPTLDSNLRVAADVESILAETLQEVNPGAIAANLGFFFDVDPLTEQTVNDVAGGSGANWSNTEKEHIRHRLGIDGSASAPSATPSLATAAIAATVDGKVDAVKAKTDSLTFTVSGKVDANVLQAGSDTIGSAAALKATSVEVNAFTAGAIEDLFTVDSGVTIGDTVGGSLVGEIVNNAGGDIPAIVDALLDEELAGHDTPGTMGALLLTSLQMGIDSSVNDSTPSASTFQGADDLATVAELYERMILVFLSGPNQGQARIVASYTAGRVFTFNAPFPAAPEDGDAFRLTGYVPA